MPRRTFFSLLLAASLTLAPLVAKAQEGFDYLETRIYFGLTTKAGELVSQQAWDGFLTDEVTPRFPAGLTVLDAYGQSSTPVEGDQTGLTTKILIVVHPATPEAAEKFIEIKAAFGARFAEPRIFHTESPIRIVE